MRIRENLQGSRLTGPDLMTDADWMLTGRCGRRVRRPSPCRDKAGDGRQRSRVGQDTPLPLVARAGATSVAIAILRHFNTTLDYTSCAQAVPDLKYCHCAQ